MNTMHLGNPQRGTVDQQVVKKGLHAGFTSHQVAIVTILDAEFLGIRRIRKSAAGKALLSPGKFWHVCVRY